MSDENPQVRVRPVFPARPQGEDTRLDWARKFYTSIEPKSLLLRKEDGSLWIAPPGQAPQRISTFEEWRGRMDSFYDFRIVKEVEKGVEREVPSSVSYEDALALYYAETKHLLPELRALVLEPAVFETSSNGARHFEVTPPGFNPNTGIFYFVPPGGDPIKPRPGTEHLEKCFSGVPFERSEYRNNLFAWLLGAVYFHSEIDFPMMVITGNTRGIGKTVTMESCGLILTGSYPHPVEHDGPEFTKQLSARFQEGARFISFDNLVSKNSKAYKNDQLSRMLTQGWSKKVRILGHSRSVEQKGVLFALTANDCRLDEDLATRSLPIKLYKDYPSPMNPFVKTYANYYRREIYGELLTLALEIPEIPFDDTLSPVFRYRKWLSFVYPRIKQHFGDMALLESRELDDAIADLYSWGHDQDDAFTFTSKILLEAMTVHFDKLNGLIEKFSTVTSTKTKAVLLTKFLNSQIDCPVEINGVRLVLRKAREGDSNHPPTYRFDRLPGGSLQ